MRDEDAQAPIEEAENTPQRGGNDAKAREALVAKIADKKAKHKALGMEIQELADSAWEKCGHTRKGILELAKLYAMDPVKRAKYQLLREEIEEGRKALGLLADLPLGQAEMERMENERAQEASRPRGRPPGSKNKPKDQQPAA